MDHHGIAHIDSYMGNAGGVVCPREKHKVAGLDIRARYWGGNVVKPLRSQSSRIAYAAVCQHIAFTKPLQSKDVLGELPPHT